VSALHTLSTIRLKLADFDSILELFPSSAKRHDSHELHLPLFILFIDTTMLEARGLKTKALKYANNNIFIFMTKIT
jgi:hypothetical protein